MRFLGSLLHASVIGAVTYVMATPPWSGFSYDGVLKLQLLAVFVGIVNAVGGYILFSRPLPLVVLTLGLAFFALNVATIFTAAFLLPGLRVNGFAPMVLVAAVAAVLAIAWKFGVMRFFQGSSFTKKEDTGW